MFALRIFAFGRINRILKKDLNIDLVIVFVTGGMFVFDGI